MKLTETITGIICLLGVLVIIVSLFIRLFQAI